jgi:hypothetical protein
MSIYFHHVHTATWPITSKYIQDKTMQKMAKVASVSVMFDEASDIQMHKHLNIFVNVSTSITFHLYIIHLYIVLLL